MIQEIAVNKGVEKTVKVITETDSGVLIDKGQDKNIEQTITFAENISAPIQQGEILGSITYQLNGEEVGKVNLIAENAIQKNTAFNMIEYVYSKWFSLFRI